MKYSDWRSLSVEEQKAAGWQRHPHIKTATLFIIAFIVVFIIVIFGISKNTTVHLNRKPTAQEAFSVAKIFVKERLKQPTTAVFPDNSFKPVIDTAQNSYQLQSTVKAINTNGKMEKSDWVDRKSVV